MSAAAAPDIDNVEDVALDALVGRVRQVADEGMRFVTTTCLDAGERFELFYHFDRDMALGSLRVWVDKGTPVPTITEVYACASLVENEMQSLFGLKVEGLAVDYQGRLLTVDDGSPPPLLKCCDPAGKKADGNDKPRAATEGA